MRGGDEATPSEISFTSENGEDERTSPKGISDGATDPVSMRMWGSGTSVSSLMSMQTDHSKNEPLNFSDGTKPIETRIRARTDLEETHSNTQSGIWLVALSRSGEATCDICSNVKARAVKFCLTCSACYCEAHIRHHYTAEALQKHELQDVIVGVVLRWDKQEENKLLSVFMETEQGEAQSPVPGAQSLLRTRNKKRNKKKTRRQKKTRMPTTLFPKDSWMKSFLIFIIFVCLVIMTSFNIFPTKESERRPASRDLTIVLLGSTGSGKSSTGNTILGREVFKAEFSPTAVTLQCEKHSGVVAGRDVTVIDAPGIFDSNLNHDEVKCEMIDRINHMFLFVVRLGRFTGAEGRITKLLLETSGEEAFQYSMVLFTGGDQLSTPVEQFLRKNNSLQELVSSCGGRYHVFNNKDKSDRTQVTELLEKMEAVLLDMARHRQVTEIIQQAQRKMQTVEQGKREEAEREIREEERRKREEAEREIREEERRKREETEREIRAEERRKMEEIVREIRAGERKNREEIEREIRAEERRKREETEREIRAEERRKWEETERYQRRGTEKEGGDESFDQDGSHTDVIKWNNSFCGCCRGILLTTNS